ncbi:MAG: nitric-oxide reductase large subunit, partial [Bacteroidales bacterium]|nr:nitric-oxide reductase large subunit [Bacteroidales bacterium]
MKTRNLWIGFLTVMTVSFAVLLFYGKEIYRQAPPVPAKVMTTSGVTLFDGQAIKDGQNVWQSMGGQELGTVWGHGAYQAPDWSADWLHREALYMLDRMATESEGKSFNNLSTDRQAALKVLLQNELRSNTYDPKTGVLKISDLRADA